MPAEPQQFTHLIGSGSSAVTIRRPKGLRYRRYFWVSREREVFPLTGMTNSHLFFTARSIEKYAGENRMERLLDLRNAMETGVDKYKNKVSKEKAIEETERLNKMTLTAFALIEYPIMKDILEELEKRGLDIHSQKDHMNAKLQAQLEMRLKMNSMPDIDPF